MKCKDCDAINCFMVELFIGDEVWDFTCPDNCPIMKTNREIHMLGIDIDKLHDEIAELKAQNKKFMNWYNDVVYVEGEEES